MYLKTLELHGFKSFPDKTVLHFNPGSTVIVGPNGSGKSNITDAMRWVLGEISTKNIRGSKMEDVIFVGADGHRPMGFAEVSVTFDDSDEPRKLASPYDEVTVTRRYYRAGESEYFINRRPCKLRDIYELFMNTGIGREGYSIIGQGKIAEIIAKKGEDRRTIFEETAGISKFRYQKHESEKKLKDTEENMTRVLDIFGEIEQRVKPLEKEAEKARKYLELYDEKKQLDVSVWLYDTEKLRADVDKFSAELRRTTHELMMAEDEENRLEARYERLFEASQENKQTAGALYAKIKLLNDRIRSAENEASRLESEISHAMTLADAAIEASNKAGDDAENEKATAEKFREKAKEIKTEAENAEKAAESLGCDKEAALAKKAEYSASLDEKFEVMRKKETERDDVRVRLDALKTTLEDRSGKESEIIAEVEKYKEKLEELKAAMAESEAAAESYAESLKKADEEIDSTERTLLKQSDKIAVFEKDLNTKQAKAEAYHSRIAALSGMFEHFDGYNNSVRFVMKRAGEGELSGIRGPVSHLIKVSEKYSTALETAFGANLQNIVCETEKDAKAAIYALKNAGAGRATFYPISSVKPQSETEEMKRSSRHAGFVGYADELLSCDGEYRDIISSIIGRTVVFDNIENASDYARSCGWKIRIVTLDGQQINVGGSFTGGSQKKDSGILSRSGEIEKLKAEESTLLSEIEKDREALEKLKAEYNSNTNVKRTAEGRAKIAETLLRTEKLQLDEYKANIAVTEDLIARLTSDRDGLTELGKRGDESIKELTAEIDEFNAEIEAIAAERREIAILMAEAEDSADDIDRAINETKIKIAELSRDMENALTSAADADERAEKQLAEQQRCIENAESLREGAKESAQKIEEKKAECDGIRAELAESEETRISLEDGNAEYDKKLNENRIKTKEVNAKKELILRENTANETKLDKLTTELDKMTSRLWDEYELTQTTALSLGYPALTEASRPAAVRRMNELKQTVRSLGNVNVGAIEEYTSLKERYDTMKLQIDDMTKSKTELESVIGSIETEMKRMFTETFEKINVSFNETFRELFGGGSAHLTLNDPENVLESGVEINVALPGKMIKNLNLLSGGEQAFVAIALIFALIKVNPSPFCIFDEIEAALDEVNVTRVANYIKRFSKEMQIIMITHRRGMMETANTLYGVTMPRHGISKVFTLDVDAVAEDSTITKELLE